LGLLCNIVLHGIGLNISFEFKLEFEGSGLKISGMTQPEFCTYLNTVDVLSAGALNP